MVARVPMSSPKQTYLSSVARLALAGLLGTAVLSVPRPANARNFEVANAGALQNAINDAQNGDTITFKNNITLSSNLPNLQKNVTINGGGFTLSGNNQYRGVFVQSGTVAINNLTISNAKAQGGNGGTGFGNGTNGRGAHNFGGGGGGGAGLGAALFVAKGANVTVSNVALTNNQARGGKGGYSDTYDSFFQLRTSGGGGSMFGNGQDGGTTLDGGGAGDGGVPGFAGGGGGGGAGGFGGGGGGAASSQAGAGGFGGGGGGVGTGSTLGKGGFGGGNGGAGAGGGGGGAGMGGAIFVQQGGVLNLAGTLTVSGNSVAAGGGGVRANGGQAYGSGVFLQGNGYLLFTPGAGQNQTVSDAIADETGVAGSGGIWGLQKNGAGTTILTGANAYSGTAIVNAGVLEGSTVSLTGSGIEDNASVIFNQTGNGTYAGVISGSGGLTKTGAGTLTLSNNGNIYAGGTTVTGGLIAFGSGSNLGIGKITLNGGGLQWARGNTIDISSRLNPIGAAGGTFDTNGNTVTLGSVLSGPGGVVKAGSGILILSASNTYAGGTTVTGGVLRFTSDANLGKAGTGITLNNGGEIGTTTDTPAAASNGRAITLAGAGGVNVALHPFTWSGPISGPGAFIKDGPGELTLTGKNTYAGGTKLFGGTLQIASDAELGTAGTAITMAGGALRASGTFTSPRNVDVLRLGGSFLVDSGQTLTLSGVISGDQNITKVGAGTLILTGANTFTGNFFNNGGVLEGNAANLGGNIFFDSNAANTIARSVVFNQATNGTYSGNIEGVGSLTKTGPGTLILAGTNSYWQGTTVAAGTLQGTTASLQGTIVNNAAVIFDQATDGTYAGSMKGPGTLTKNGTGTVKLAGTSSVGGGTALNAGGLWVDGNLTSDVSVNGGVLRGTGNITGNVIEDGGRVEPGDIGILTINGNYTIDRGTYETEITPILVPGVGDDELVVHGMTKLAGNLLVLVDPRNNYTLGQPYDILHATDGVSGRFAAVATDPDFAGYLDPVVSYEPTDVLFRLNPTEKLFQSGQQAADMQTAILSAAAGVADTVLADSCDASAEGSTAPKSDCVIRPLGNGIHSEVWLRGVGGIGNLYGSGTRSSFTDNYGGMLIGYGVDFGHFTVGLGAGYLATGLNFADGSNATENTGVGFAYARYAVDRFRIDAMAGYGGGTVDGKRTLPGTGFTAESSRAGNFGLFAVRAAYDLPLGAYTLEPRAAFAYAHAHQGDFSESGASLLDLGYSGLNTNETTGRLTLRLKRSFTLAGWHLAPWIEGGVQETFSGLSRTANVSAGLFDETVAGISPAPTAGIAGLGIRLAAAKNLDGFIRYQGLFSGNGTANTFSAGLRYRF